MRLISRSAKRSVKAHAVVADQQGHLVLAVFELDANFAPDEFCALISPVIDETFRTRQKQWA